MADALIEQRGHVLIVTMNRPETRNALSGEMLSIMVEAWDRVDSDPDIRVCILTGAGGYFCAGMDLKAATAKPPGDSFKDGSYDPSRIDGLLKGRRLTKPLIAAVEGPAIAGGTEILPRAHPTVGQYVPPVSPRGGGTADYGFEHVKVHTPAGTVKVYADADCPTNRGYVGKMSAIYLKHLKGLPHIVQDDGRPSLRSTSADDIEARVRSWCNLISPEPGCWGVFSI
jgi:hypothetical protein